MELQVEVTNAGEDAFEAKFKLRLEQNLRFVKLKDERSTWTGTKNIEGEEEATANMLCSPPDKNNGWTLECNLGNPMLAGNKVIRPPFVFHVRCDHCGRVPWVGLIDLSYYIVCLENMAE